MLVFGSSNESLCKTFFCSLYLPPLLGHWLIGVVSPSPSALMMNGRYTITLPQINLIYLNPFASANVVRHDRAYYLFADSDTPLRHTQIDLLINSFHVQKPISTSLRVTVVHKISRNQFFSSPFDFRSNPVKRTGMQPASCIREWEPIRLILDILRRQGFLHEMRKLLRGLLSAKVSCLGGQRCTISKVRKISVS